MPETRFRFLTHLMRGTPGQSPRTGQESYRYRKTRRGTFFMLWGVSNRGAGGNILDSKGSKPLTDEGMLAANKKMSNKFLHFAQVIDYRRKKSC